MHKAVRFDLPSSCTRVGMYICRYLYGWLTRVFPYKYYRCIAATGGICHSASNLFSL